MKLNKNKVVGYVALVVAVFVAGGSFVAAQVLSPSEKQQKAIAQLIEAYESYAVGSGFYPAEYNPDLLVQQGYLDKNSLAVSHLYLSDLTTLANTNIEQLSQAEESEVEPKTEFVEEDVSEIDSTAVDTEEELEDTNTEETAEQETESPEQNETIESEALSSDPITEEVSQDEAPQEEKKVEIQEEEATEQVVNDSSAEPVKELDNFPISILYCQDKVAIFSVSDVLFVDEQSSQWWASNGCDASLINSVDNAYFHLSEGDLLLL